jgi:hypothetical protein
VQLFATAALAQLPEPPHRGVFCELDRQHGGYASRPDHAVAGEVLVYEQRGWVLAWSTENNDQHLTFFDTSEPAEIDGRGTLAFPGSRPASAGKALADGDMAVAFVDEQGLHIIDLSDPDAPQLVGLLPISDLGSLNWVYGFVDGRVLVFWGDFAQVRVVDVRDPANPVLEATWPADLIIAHIDGDRTYTVRDGNVLTVLDISDPTTPQELGRIELDDATDAARLAVGPDGIAYVPHGSWVPPYSGGLYIIDMSDPADMRLLGSVDTGIKGVPQVYGDRLYVSGLDDPQRPIGLIYDLADPTDPTLIGRAGGQFYNLENETIYVASARGISAIDLSVFPPSRTTHEVASLDAIYGVASKDHALYVSAEPDRLLVFDASDPTALVLTRQLTASPGPITSLGNSLVLANETEGLVMYDVAAPLDPQRLGDLDLPMTSGPTSVAFQWPLALTTNRNEGLRVIDVSNRAAPRLAWAPGSSDQTWTTNAILVDSHAFVLNEYNDGRSASTSLQVFDLTNPDAPVGVSTHSAPYASDTLFRSGDRVWAGGRNGFFGLNIADRSAPFVIAEYGERFFGSMVLRDRDYLHSPYGQVLDLRDALDPKLLSFIPAEYPDPGFTNPQSVTRLGDDMFFGGSTGVLYRVDLRECQPCRADLDADGTLTIFDFLAFQNAFSAGDPIADFDGDGELTIFDFLAFQNAFDAGCE